MWDSEIDDDAQMMGHLLRLFEQHADTELPVVDFGCGNGRRSAWLAQHFARVVCADVSQAALALAEQTTCAGLSNVQFELLDMTDSSATAAFSERLGGDANVYTRGVLHLIKEKHRATVADNLHAMIGKRGIFYFYETDSTALDYLLTKPADNSASGLPAVMQKVLEHGILPSGFGAEAHEQWFSDPNKWDTISAGPTTLTTIAFADGEPGAVPSFFALMRASSPKECEV